MRSHQQSETTPLLRRRGVRVAIGAVAVGAVLTPMAAWAAGAPFDDVPESDPGFESIMAVADAGLMTGSQHKFRPDQNVPRRALAATLYRGLTRVSVDDTISNIPTSQPDPPAIGEIAMAIDGYQRGAQGVLLELDMQVETAQPLTQDCSLELIATSWPENFDVGTWTVNLYAGQPRGTTVHATFLDGQLAGTAYTYEITADNTCNQPLNVVQGSLTGQSAAFQGNGQPFSD